MKVLVTKDFEKNIKEIRDKHVAASVQKIIIRLQQCNSLKEIPNAKKMKGTDDFFRVRSGDYRLGLKQIENGVLLLCFLHRKDVYKYFPANY